MTTVLETIDGGTRYLEKRGVEDARRNMQMLVAHRLGCSRMDLYLRFDRPLDEDALAPLRESLRKRGEGVPLQHLLGSVAFLHHEFRCDSRALIPRPETEELTAWILECEPEPQRRALDMGCGSGVIGLSLAAARPEWELTLADLSPEALTLARENAELLEIDRIPLVHSDLFSAITGRFDLIAANLPYVPDGERETLAREVHHDPASALFAGSDGLEVIRRFVPAAFSHLNPGGRVFLEIGHDQAHDVSRLLEEAGFTDIQTKTDLSGVPRFPSARKPC